MIDDDLYNALVTAFGATILLIAEIFETKKGLSRNEALDMTKHYLRDCSSDICDCLKENK